MAIRSYLRGFARNIASHSQWPSMRTCLPHFGQMVSGVGASSSSSNRDICVHIIVFLL
jgi:hypothetical protein